MISIRKDKLGLKRNTIKLQNHNPKWREDFLREKTLLLKILNNKAVRVEHIGSTAIPEICAKPILDIAVEMKDFKALDFLEDKLEASGFVYRPMHDEPGRRLYIKGGNDYRTHHIHFYEKDNKKFEEDLFFRDCLTKHPEVAKEYNGLKCILADKYPNDRKQYTAGKEKFIAEVVNQKI